MEKKNMIVMYEYDKWHVLQYQFSLIVMRVYKAYASASHYFGAILCVQAVLLVQNAVDVRTNHEKAMERIKE